jgi:hypothetical protein
MGAASVAAGDYHQDHPVQLEGEELVATFFNSSVPCALIDERGSVSRASVAFSALVPNAFGLRDKRNILNFYVRGESELEIAKALYSIWNLQAAVGHAFAGCCSFLSTS